MNTTTSTITTTTPTTTTLRPLNTVPPLPDWLADDDSSDFEYLIPGMPGSAQIKNVVRNLKKLGAAIYLNSLSSQDLHGQMAGIMQLNDFRQDAIERMGSLLMKKINTTREGMKILATTFGEAYQNISETLDMLSLFKSKIVADLYPQLFGIKMVARDIEFLTDIWTLGVIDLTSGFLPPQIITEEMLLKVIKIIQNEVLKRPAFGNFNLLSRLPGFYYKTKNMVTYTRTNLKLILTLSIPLYQDSGRYTLYKIFCFPIPFTMGTTNDDSKGQYTLIKDLPAFIAVVKNTESYVELNEAQFLSCVGGVKEILSCGNGVGVPRRKNLIEMSCAFSLFIDEVKAVKKFCNIVHLDTYQQGYARQLSSDSSFLISNGDYSENIWTINCPTSSINSITKVKPCNLCRMEIECGCSLSADHFKINPRLSGCDIGALQDLNRTSKIYTRNTNVVTEFVTNEDINAVKSYAAKINELFPPIPIKKIVYKIQDNIPQYIEASQKLGKNFLKGAELIKKNLSIYAEKVDQGLTEARDFSDQVVDRDGSILKGLSGLIGDLFGGNILQIIALIFSPIFLSLLSIIISAYTFIPTLMYDIREYKKDRKQAKNDKIMEKLQKELINDGTNNDDDDVIYPGEEKIPLLDRKNYSYQNPKLPPKNKHVIFVVQVNKNADGDKILKSPLII